MEFYRIKIIQQFPEYSTQASRMSPLSKGRKIKIFLSLLLKINNKNKSRIKKMMKRFFICSIITIISLTKKVTISQMAMGNKLYLHKNKQVSFVSPLLLNSRNDISTILCNLFWLYYLCYVTRIKNQRVLFLGLQSIPFMNKEPFLDSSRVSFNPGVFITCFLKFCKIFAPFSFFYLLSLIIDSRSFFLR